MKRTLEQILEVLGFGADEPIQPSRIAEVYKEVHGGVGPTDAEIEEAVERLNRRYQKAKVSFRFYHWAGGYRLATLPELASYLQSFYKNSKRRKLSRSLMETIAIISYRQPITRPEVDFIRGVESDYSVRKLLGLGLIDVAGRADSVGRPLLYRTTNYFLELFGLNALNDLPNLREVEDILKDPTFDKERARLLLDYGLKESVETPNTNEKNPEVIIVSSDNDLPKSKAN